MMVRFRLRGEERRGEERRGEERRGEERRGEERRGEERRRERRGEERRGEERRGEERRGEERRGGGVLLVDRGLRVFPSLATGLSSNTVFELRAEQMNRLYWPPGCSTGSTRHSGGDGGVVCRWYCTLPKSKEQQSWVFRQGPHGPVISFLWLKLHTFRSEETRTDEGAADSGSSSGPEDERKC
ncbi:hypothetical protein D4764_04G0007780 [Takifugu flavidus]|uniref:Uncharacterized protein n=1 Tax=Takifugu flavidus TaxID=433684 RepID=A0A5C6N786_9TELE|nr:hypothetical protein D4764_04G0007780 [Takifugu flavidus]